MFSDYRVLLAAGLAAVILLSLFAYLLRRSRGRPVDPMRAVSVKVLHDILLPDRMGGQIHLQHVLLTAKGFVVLDLKTVSGTVFAGDRMEEWTVIGNAQRFTFPNPQPALYDRVAALKTVIRDMPVAGHILFFDDADFSKGRPSDVIFPGELEERYRKPESAELERLMDAFQPHWEKLQEASEPAPRATKPV